MSSADGLRAVCWYTVPISERVAAGVCTSPPCRLDGGGHRQQRGAHTLLVGAGRVRDDSQGHRAPANASASQLQVLALLEIGKMPGAATDAHWAAGAHALGYDSVQIIRGPDMLPEMVVSRHACLSTARPIGVCPPLELRTGDAATRPCACSESVGDLLNCGT